MDTAILLWIQENLRCGFTEWFFPMVTFLGDKGLIWLVIAGIMLFFRAYRKWGIALLCTLALTALIGEVLLKHLVERPRPFTHFPELQLLIPEPNSFSFPGPATVPPLLPQQPLYSNAESPLESLLLFWPD